PPHFLPSFPTRRSSDLVAFVTSALSSVKVLFLTNEYSPHIYGGAGVHVGYLSRELAKMMPVEVRCFGDQRLDEGNLEVIGFELRSEEHTSELQSRSDLV